MRKVIFIMILMVLAFLTIGCGINEDLKATGTIQGKEVILTTRIPAKVEDVLVKEGQEVKIAQELLLLEDVEFRLNLTQAEAGLELAEAQLNEILKGTRYEEVNKAKATMRQFEANMEASQANLANLKKRIQQQEKLFKTGATSQQQLDDLYTQRTVLELQIEAIERQIEVALWQVAILENGPREEVVDRLRAQVKINEASLKLAEYKMSQTVIKSPIEGRINALSVEKGENVNAGFTLVSIINPADLWVRVFISENEIGRISIGDEVEIKIDSYPEKKFSKVK